MRPALTIVENDKLANNWEWEVEFKALAIQRLKRLENQKLALSELWEELQDITLEAFTYFSGLDDEAQRHCARDMRDVLREIMSLKERMRVGARKQIARRTNPNSLGIRLSEDLRKLKADFNRRHPTTQWLKSR